MPSSLSNCNTHHVFFPRNEYRQHKVAKQLRDYWYCKITIPITLHDHIHHRVKMVPIPPERVAKRVLTSLKDFHRYGAIMNTDTAENRLKLIIHLIGSSAPETTKALKQQLQLIQNART